MTQNQALSQPATPVRVLSAVLAIHLIAPQTFGTQPFLVSLYADRLGFGADQAGMMAAAENGGMAAATLLLAFFGGRIARARGFVLAGLLIAGGNLLSILPHDPILFGLTRFLAGAGAGAGIALAYAVLAVTDRPDRNFGLALATLTLFGAGMFAALPVVAPLIGFGGLMAFFAAAGLLILPLSRLLPAGSGAAGTEPAAGSPASDSLSGASPAPLPPGAFPAVLALGAMGAYFISLGGLWAYLFLIGTGNGLSEDQVGTALAVMNLFAIAGALCAGPAVTWLARHLAAAGAILAVAVPLAFLAAAREAVEFSVLLCVFAFFQNMSHPLLLGAMSHLDPTGKLVVRASALQMIGISLGPAFAAQLVDSAAPGGISRVAGAGFALSAIMILLALTRRHSR